MENILACLTSSGLTAIILACLQRRWAKADRQDVIVDALKVLMIDRVRYLGKCYITDDGITLEDKEVLEDMHKAYKALGGNGHLDTVMAEVHRLRVVDR